MKPNTPGFISTQLRKARLSRGKTAVALAEDLGITKQEISNYETGRQSPSPSVAANISEVLNYPISFFLKKSFQENEISPHFYRSMKAATKIAREKAENKADIFVGLTAIVESMIEMPVPNFPRLSIPSDPLDISDVLIEEYAVQVRKFWGLGDGPISNTIWLLENNGAFVVRRNLESSTLDAFSFWCNDRPYIFLNSEKNSAVRSRFDLAHELGHLVLHRQVDPEFLENSDSFNLLEKQANRFAGAFLFPHDSFVREVLRYDFDSFIRLKKRWKVSVGMIVVRCQNIDLFSEKRGESLWRSYARNGWKKFEPLDDVIEVETPYLFQESIQLMITENLMSRSELEEEIAVYHYDVEDAAGLPQNILNPSLDTVRRFQPKVRVSNRMTDVDAVPNNLVMFSR